MNDNMRSMASRTKNYTQGFIISNFLLVETGRLRNLLILTFIQTELYSKFFQVFVYIFEIHIIRKMFPKLIDTVASMGCEKNFHATCQCLFLKLGYFSNSIQRRI